MDFHQSTGYFKNTYAQDKSIESVHTGVNKNTLLDRDTSERDDLNRRQGDQPTNEEVQKLIDQGGDEAQDMDVAKSDNERFWDEGGVRRDSASEVEDEEEEADAEEEEEDIEVPSKPVAKVRAQLRPRPRRSRRQIYSSGEEDGVKISLRRGRRPKYVEPLRERYDDFDESGVRPPAPPSGQCLPAPHSAPQARIDRSYFNRIAHPGPPSAPHVNRVAQPVPPAPNTAPQPRQLSYLASLDISLPPRPKFDKRTMIVEAKRMANRVSQSKQETRIALFTEYYALEKCCFVDKRRKWDGPLCGDQTIMVEIPDPQGGDGECVQSWYCAFHFKSRRHHALAFLN